MHEVTVTFLGGSSGHFVANVVANMLYGTKVRVTEVGSAHEFSSGIGSDYYEVLTDPDPQSAQWAEFEERMVRTSKPSPVFMMHCMNLRMLARHCRKLVYITFEDNHLPLFGRRHLYKIPAEQAREKYELWAGADWPPYDDYVANPSLIIDEYEQCMTMPPGRWQWLMPEDKTSLHSIPFSTLHNGQFIQPLASFLGAKYDASYLKVALDEYNLRQSIW